MSDWLPNGRVIRPAVGGVWKTKRNGKWVSSAQLEREALQAMKKRSLAKGARQAPKASQAQTKPTVAAGAKAPAAKRTKQKHATDGAPTKRTYQAPTSGKTSERRGTQPASKVSKATIRQDLHDAGKPCGDRNCARKVCAEASRTIAAKKKRIRSARSGGEAGTKSELRGGQYDDRWKLKIHDQLRPCGVSACKDPICRKALAMPERAVGKTSIRGGRQSVTGVVTGGGTTAGRSAPKRGEQLAVERAQAKHRAKSQAPQPATTAKSVATPKSAKTPTTPRREPRLTCRECLKAKPLSAFPNPSHKRCAACGGQAPSVSVRAISGGAPGLGRRR